MWEALAFPYNHVERRAIYSRLCLNLPGGVNQCELGQVCCGIFWWLSMTILILNLMIIKIILCQDIG